MGDEPVEGARGRLRDMDGGPEPIGDARQMTGGAGPGRRRRPERGLEGLMPEMRHQAVRFGRRRNRYLSNGCQTAVTLRKGPV